MQRSSLEKELDKEIPFRLNFLWLSSKIPLRNWIGNNKGIKINQKHLSHPQFAYNIFIFSKSPEELKEVLKGLTEGSITVR